jgi:hypothetical protein
MTKINHDNKGLLMNVKESLHICLYNKKGHFIDEQKQAENSMSLSQLFYIQVKHYFQTFDMNLLR